MKQVSPNSATEYVVVFTPYITLRNGRRIYAQAYGLKAFAIKVRKSQAG